MSMLFQSVYTAFARIKILRLPTVSASHQEERPVSRDQGAAL